MKLFSQKIADEFIERYLIGEFKIDGIKASKIPCSYNYQNMNLLQFLSESIQNYITAKSNVEGAFDEESRKKAYEEEAEWRTHLLTWITHARNVGVIIETETLVSKVKKLEQENFQLKEQITELRKQYDILAKENERLHNLFPDNQKGNVEYGDVE